MKRRRKKKERKIERRGRRGGRIRIRRSRSSSSHKRRRRSGKKKFEGKGRGGSMLESKKRWKIINNFRSSFLILRINLLSNGEALRSNSSVCLIQICL